MTRDKRLTAGVLGGMGPDATVDFMARVVALVSGSRDQDHVPMIVDHNPQVPDRQAAMRGDRAPVNAALLAMARRLQAAGADFLVMPCNTAHVFLHGIEQAVDIPLLHIIDETVSEIGPAVPGARQVGLLATDACLESGIYQQAITRSAREAVLPDDASQAELMRLIARIKSGDRSEPVAAALAQIAERLVQQGAQLIVAGCTEIPLVLHAASCSVPVLSSTEVLAKRTVAVSTGKESLPQE